MPRTRPAYPPEFRAQMVALARTGRSVEELAREFEPSAHTIRGWVRAAGRHGGGHDPAGGAGSPSEAERTELQRLRREVRQLRQERDILAKAAAWFARNDATSSRSSSS
jgi:transposase